MFILHENPITPGVADGRTPRTPEQWVDVWFRRVLAAMVSRHRTWEDVAFAARILHGFAMPILEPAPLTVRCVWCKELIADHGDTPVSHGICAACLKAASEDSDPVASL